MKKNTSKIANQIKLKNLSRVKNCMYVDVHSWPLGNLSLSMLVNNLSLAFLATGQFQHSKSSRLLKTIFNETPKVENPQNEKENAILGYVLLGILLLAFFASWKKDAGGPRVLYPTAVDLSFSESSSLLCFFLPLLFFLFFFLG